MKLSEEDIESLAAAVDFVLSELDQAEQQVSFPRPGENPSIEDDAEWHEREDAKIKYLTDPWTVLGQDPHGH